MRVGPSHLTYCTNIHPGETSTEVLANLRRYLPEVRSEFGDGAFGVGLRLSAQAARSLRSGPQLNELASFLREGGYYVFTINGFPYGSFHGQPVKEQVYEPDWAAPERSSYTRDLASLLALLCPEGTVGSISTVPGGFRPKLQRGESLRAVRDNLLETAAFLAQIHRETGRELVLALEPEPHCLLETTREAIDYLEGQLFTRSARRFIAQKLGVAPGEAETLLRRHLGICLDTCHAAVEFEDPDETLDALLAAEIRIAKLQLSCGLLVNGASNSRLAALWAYDEPVYLHQVVAQRDDGELLRFLDLPEALDSEAAKAAPEWRVHFHVPLYRRNLGAFENTQAFLERVLERHRTSPVSDHLEVETYTWDVLPPEQRAGGISRSIARELEWVKRRLDTAAQLA